MTNKEISQLYWQRSEGLFVNPVPELMKAAGVKTLHELLGRVGSWVRTRECQTCGAAVEFVAKSRTQYVAMSRQIRDYVTFCPECEEKQREAQAKRREEEEWREQEAERLAAQERREKRKATLMLKHGAAFLDTPCPVCDGWLVAKLNSATMRVFAGCSSFNSYRSSSCRYSQPIALDLQDKFREVFRIRLAAVRTPDVEAESRTACHA